MEDRCSSELKSELKEALEWKSSAEIEFKKAADAGKLLLDRIDVLETENQAIKQQEKNYELLSSQMIMRESGAPRLTVTGVGGKRASIEHYTFEQHRRSEVTAKGWAWPEAEPFPRQGRLSGVGGAKDFEDEIASEPDASPTHKSQPCRTRGLTKDFEELLLENEALQETNRMLQEQLCVKRDSMAEASDVALTAAAHAAAHAPARLQDPESSSDSEQEDSGDDAQTGDGQKHADGHANRDHYDGDVHLLVRHLRQQLDKARDNETQIREEMKLRLAKKAREMNMVKAESTNLKMMCISETMEVKNVQRLYDETNFRAGELQLRITQLQEKLSTRQMRRNSTLTAPQFQLEEEAEPSVGGRAALELPRMSLANEFAEVDEITNDEVDELVCEVSSLKDELASAEDELHRMRKELVDTRTRLHRQDSAGTESSGLEGPESSECRELRRELKEAQDRQADLRLRCQVLQDERRDALAQRGLQRDQSAQPADPPGAPPTHADGPGEAGPGAELPQLREEALASDPAAALATLQAAHGEELASQKCLLQDEHREELAMQGERARQRHPSGVCPDESASEAGAADDVEALRSLARATLREACHRGVLAASLAEAPPQQDALATLKAAHGEELAAQRCLLQDEHREELAVHEEQARQRPPFDGSPDESASDPRLQQLQAALATLQTAHGEELAAQKCLLQDEHREELAAHEERARQRLPSEVSLGEPASEARLQQLQAAHGEELAAQKCLLQDEHREELAVNEERARQRPSSEVGPDESVPEVRLQELQELKDKHQDELVVQRDQLLEEHRTSEAELRRHLLGEHTGALAAQRASLMAEHRASLYLQISSLQDRQREDVGLLQDQHRADKAELAAQWVGLTEALEAREAQLKEELTRHREDVLDRARTLSLDSMGEPRLEVQLLQLQDQHRADLAAQKARLQEEHRESLIEHRERWESAALGGPDFSNVDSQHLLVQDDQGFAPDRQQEMQHFWEAQHGAEEPRQSDWWGNVCSLLTCTRAPPCVRNTHKRKPEFPPQAPPGG